MPALHGEIDTFIGMRCGGKSERLFQAMSDGGDDTSFWLLGFTFGLGLGW